MTTGRISPLFTWRGAIAAADLTSTTKLVALVLSLYMSERGGSAFPGVERLARDAALGRRTVQVGLRALEEGGWLEVVREGGGRGRATVYQAAVPETAHTVRGSTKGAPDDVKRAHLTTPKSAGGAPHHVSTTPSTTPENLAPKPRRRDELWEAVLEACGLDPFQPLSTSARGAYNRAVRELRDLGATPGEVRRRAGNAMGNLSPPGLARYWAELDSPPRAARGRMHPVDRQIAGAMDSIRRRAGGD